VYVRNDASKMKFNIILTRKKSGISDFQLRTSNLFEVENWVVGKETDKHIVLSGHRKLG